MELGAAPQARYLFTYDITGTFAESKRQALERHYAAKNPLIIQGRSLLVPGRPGHRLEACSDEVYLKSEFYNDFMRHNDTLQIFGGVLIQTGHAAVMLSGSGSHHREPFGDPELRLLGAVMPHLQTAFYLQDRLRMTEDRLVRLKTAFEISPDALILLAGGARVLELNHAARRFLDQRDGLSLTHDRLRIGDGALDSKLARVLKSFSLANRLGIASPPKALRIPRPSGAPDWLLQIFPAEHRMPGAALVFLTTRPAGQDLPTEADLANLFGLSLMQRRIALRLLEGQTPGEIAERLGITRNTMKTHLRRLFQKLGVFRQTELIRLLSRLKPGR